MQRDVKFTEARENLIAALECDIDHHTARLMREKIDKMLFERRPSVLILDFSSVVFMDSSGLGLIMGRVECATAIGARVILRGMSPALTKLVHLCGIDRLQGLTLECERERKSHI